VPEATALANEQTIEVREALSELPDDQRKVIELSYFSGFSQSEIAEITDQPLGTVKGRMRLGLEKMRANLEPEEVQAS
jgi:RNA polymerase sigma-70 factor (ECF subfamily)